MNRLRSFTDILNMNMLDLTPQPIDEHDLLMLIARQAQTEIDAFLSKVQVIHLDSDVSGMTKISEVKTFENEGDGADYYYSNGRTTRPVILIKPYRKGGVGMLLSGEKYFKAIIITSSEIKTDFESKRSQLNSQKMT
jgi:hypothetical protein